MDPVHLLREYINQGKEVVHDERSKELVFGPHRFADSVPVDIEVQGTTKHYTLGGLWFFGITFVATTSRDQGGYMRECSIRHFPVVSLLDRKSVQTWFQQAPDQTTEAFERPTKRTKTDDGLADNGQELKESNTSENPVGIGAFAAETGFSSEKIAALKQKRLSQMKKISGEVAMEEESQEALKFMKELAAREVPLCTATTILQSPSHKEFDSIFAAVQKMITNEKREKQEKEKESVRKARAVAAASHNRYETTNEDDFWKANKHSAAVEFAIDTHGSFAGINPLPRPPKPTAPPRNEADKTAKRPRSESDSRQSSRRPSKPENACQFIPIIIVPGSANPDTLISLYNIEQFICKSVYQTPTEAKAAKGPIKGNRIKLSYTRKNGQSIDFLVVDNATKLEPREWDHVVAVFVQGQEWQFKGWKWPSPAQIFSKVRGFFMIFEDEKVPICVTNWNVALLQVNKHKRHLDNPAAMKFWEAVDLELAKRKWIAPVAPGKK